MPRPLFATALFALSLPLAAQTTLPPAVTAAQSAVSAGSIRAYDKYLSDDLLEGRYPGQRGGQLAAKFIATQFESYGLKPGGDNGTYFQQVDFTSVKADPVKTTFTLLPKSGAPIKLKFADDFVVFNEKLTPSVALNAPIVWVGYGITAPEFHWDDFANIDVKGKVILCLVNDPPSDDPAFFGGKSLTYYGRWTYKFEQAARKGAIGALIIHRTDLAAYGWDVVRNSNISEKTFLAHDENPAPRSRQLDSARRSQTDLHRQRHRLRHRVRRRRQTRLQVPRASHQARRHRSQHRAQLPVPQRHRHDSPARKRGPSRRSSGHLHRPLRPPRHQDRRQARRRQHLQRRRRQRHRHRHDHGDGSRLHHRKSPAAALDHLRRSHGRRAGPARLRRISHSILPSPSASSTSTSTSTRSFPSARATSSTLAEPTAPPSSPPSKPSPNSSATRSPAPRPDTAGGYYRSDHFSFAHAGVPAFSLGQGGTYKGHDEAWSRAQGANYGKNDYHNVSDNFHEDWDFTGNATLCRLGIELGWLSVTQPRIEWNPGDEFEAARKASR